MNVGIPALHERFPELRERLPHLCFGTRPTPVRPLPGLSERGTPVWLKDDGAFGSGGWGGNKVRKLEWILPDVLARTPSRTILTVGGLGTNWGLATALYGRRQGLRTVLVLVDQPIDDHVRAQLARLERSGATLHFAQAGQHLSAILPGLLAQHSDGGHPPCFLPIGGSSPIGTLGYVEAALELAAQVEAGALPEPSHVVVTLGSGGTTAGLVLGLRLAGLRTRVVGVVVNDGLPLDAHTVVGLARNTEQLLRDRGAKLPALGLQECDVTVVRDWLGPGYGHPTPEAERARELAGAREGLGLDPVYTAKTMAAVLAMAAGGRFGAGPVLYVHTHGPRPATH